MRPKYCAEGRAKELERLVQAAKAQRDAHRASLRKPCTCGICEAVERLKLSADPTRQ